MKKKIKKKKVWIWILFIFQLQYDESFFFIIVDVSDDNILKLVKKKVMYIKFKVYIKLFISKSN